MQHDVFKMQHDVFKSTYKVFNMQHDVFNMHLGVIINMRCVQNYHDAFKI